MAPTIQSACTGDDNGDTQERARAVASLAAALDANFFRAIAEPVRQQIVLILLQHGRSNVQDVASHLVQDRSVVSRHLSFLEQAGMVRSYRVQRFMEYELDGQAIIMKFERLLDQLRSASAICCPPEPVLESNCSYTPHHAAL
jgi:ArsR family transcriptional regulator